MIFKKDEIVNRHNRLKAITEAQTLEQRVAQLETTITELLFVLENYAVGCTRISTGAQVLTADLIGIESRHSVDKF